MKYLRYGWPLKILASVGAVLFIALGVSFQVAHGQSGGAGGGSTGACSNYCTDNGFAWKKYSVGGGGPSGGLNGWSWSSVQSTCKNVEDVWIHVVLDGGNREKAFAFQLGNGVTNGPPYSAYTQAHYYGSEDINTVHGYYDEAVANGISGTSGLTWGNNLEWFCYSSNPPWTIETSVSVDRTISEPGDTITWTHTVKNTGTHKTNKDVTWHYQNRGDWGNASGTDWKFVSGSKPGASDTETSSYTVLQSDFGRKICRATSAQPLSNTNGGWTESNAACVTIAKRPKVQIRGNDLRVRGTGANQGNVTTSMSRSSGKWYGSWSEYGIAPAKRVVGMASGSGLVGGVANPDLCRLSLLTFNNTIGASPATCNSASIGNYSQISSSPLSDIISRFKVQASTPVLTGDVAVSTLDSGKVYGGNGVIRLSSPGTIAKGKWVVINAPQATVRIVGNISYSTVKVRANEIPQLVIIARNIIIDSDVVNVDAWLLARGSGSNGALVTCDAASSAEPSGLTANVCAKKLVVNGPVMANHLLMYRTAEGMGAAVGVPAEVFNLRPDAYLWAQSLSANSARMETVHTVELPPRY